VKRTLAAASLAITFSLSFPALADGGGAYIADTNVATCLELLDRCQHTKTQEMGAFCLGYFDGFLDALERTDHFCLPYAPGEYGRLLSEEGAYLSWAERNPDKLRDRADVCVAAAFAEAFPCAAKK
jgi:hypothetical protein